MKKILIVLSFIFMINSVQANEPLNIGVVDFGYIMTYSNATKSINQQIDAKKEEFMAKDKEAQSKIIKKQQALAERKSIISINEFEIARKSLEEDIKIEQAKSRRNRMILENGIQEARKFLDKAIRKYIAKIAEE
jgi:Skp family chaperone for outer membrane proteins